MAEEEEFAPEIIMAPEQMAGNWANYARVSHSPYEFTLDFIRLEFTPKPSRGIVVSRVSVSPLFISQLIDALQKNWEIYARKALPPEVHGDPGLQIRDIGAGQDDSDSGAESERDADDTD